MGRLYARSLTTILGYLEMKISGTSTPFTMKAGKVAVEPPSITSEILNFGTRTITDGIPISSIRTVLLGWTVSTASL